MPVLKMVDLDLAGKRVLIRQDLNVPLKDGIVTSEKRVVASLPTIKIALERGAAVIIMSHLGRPVEGTYDEKFSLAPVAKLLEKKLGQAVRLEKEWLNGLDVKPGEVVLCENVRFCAGEKKNDPELGKKMAALCDIYVMDAFGTAHRAHASTNAVATAAPVACAGPLLASELDALETGLNAPQRPMVAICGGSKVSSKLSVLLELSKKVDQLIVGGGIANTFLKAAGYNVGTSLVEEDQVSVALELLEAAKADGAAIPLPVDVVVSKAFDENAEATTKTVDQVGEDEMILDIGPETSKLYDRILKDSSTIIWNGPVGVFEFDQFAQGTEALCRSVAESDAFSVAGGGDTVAAIDKYGVEKEISYISTGGGAFLEFVEGKKLPAVAVLESRFEA